MRRGIRLAMVLAAFTVLFLGAGLTVTASDEAAPPEETPEQKAEREATEMKIESNELENWPQGPATRGEAAIVMEAGTGAILYAKNIDAKEFPASITKVLTALVALENGSLEDSVAFSHESVSFLQPGDSSVGLKEGNVISLDQALHATLLASANEAAYAVAESVGRNAGHDYNWFIEQMNLRCQELGGKESNFINANGLHDPNHYTSARDMALIGRELFKHPDFFRIVQTQEYRIGASGTCEEHVFQQKHRMLIPGKADYYEYAVGGKTGFTSDALSTLITMADNGETKLVCVVLRTHGANVYADTRSLLDYGFGNFKKAAAADNEESKDVEEIILDDAGATGYVMLPEGVDFKDLKKDLEVPRGQMKEGTLTYSYKGFSMGSAKVKLSDAYRKEHSIKIQDISKKENIEKGSPLGKTLETAVIALGVVGAALFGYKKLVADKKRRRHSRRRH